MKNIKRKKCSKYRIWVLFILSFYKVRKYEGYIESKVYVIKWNYVECALNKYIMSTKMFINFLIITIIK